MATLAQPSARWRNDRLFYTTMGVAIAFTGVFGFARSYYFSRWMEPLPGTPQFTTLLHVHAAVFTLWLVLNVVQPALVASNNRRLHRKVGYAGAAIATLMVIVGNMAAIAATRRTMPGFPDPLVFYAIPFFAINVFAVIVALAIYWRNKAETHKRLMLLASTQILEAAIARVVLGMTGALDPLPLFAFSDLIIVAGAGYDLLSGGKVHRVWIVGGALVVASQFLRIAIMGTQPWLAFARFMTGLG